MYHILLFTSLFIIFFMISAFSLWTVHVTIYILSSNECGMNILSQIHMIIILIYFAILHTILSICSYFECSHVYRVMAMVFNVTFYNMSVISWRSALLMGETTNLPYVTGKLYHLKLYRVQYTSPLAEFESATLLVIYADCTTSYKFNYHRITTTCCSSFKIFIVLIIC